MRFVLSAGLASVAVAALAGAGQTPPRTLTIKFPADVAAGSCEIASATQGDRHFTERFQGAPKGDGIYSYSPRNGDRQTWVRAVVDCRGRGVSLVDVGLGPGETVVSIDPAKLQSVHLRGTIAVPPGGGTLAGLEVAVLRGMGSAMWRDCMYLMNPTPGRAISCLTPGEGPLVAVAAIAADGTFEVDLPDFAKDPGVPAGYRETLLFRARPPGETRAVFDLAPPPQGPTVSGRDLPVSTSYPTMLAFQAISVR